MSAKKILNISLVCIGTVYLVNYLGLGFWIAHHDYNEFAAYYEIAWRSWITGNLFSDFNPFLCGGRTLVGDPQIPVWSPLALASGIFGPVLVYKLELLTQLFLGCLGLWGLLEIFDCSPLGKRWGLFLYLCGGAIIARFYAGHAPLGCLILFPLLLYIPTLFDGLHAWSWRVFYWLLFIYCSHYKPHLFLFALPLLGLNALTHTLIHRKLGFLIELGIATILAVLINAVMYLPSLEYFTLVPRMEGTEPGLIGPWTLLANLLMPLRTLPEFFYSGAWRPRHEYTVFLGPVALYFAWKGFSFFKTPKEKKAQALLLSLALMALTGFVIGLGRPSDQLSLFPLSWLHQYWPGFQGVRVPTRFWYFVFLFLLILSAKGFTISENRGPKIAWLILGILPLLLSATINLSLPNIRGSGWSWNFPRQYAEIPENKKSGENDIFQTVRQGHGSLFCSENVRSYPASDLKEMPLGYDFTTYKNSHWTSWSSFFFSPHSTPHTFNLSDSVFWHPNDACRRISNSGQLLQVKCSLSKTLYMDFKQKTPTLAKIISLISLISFLVFLILFRFFKKPLLIGITGNVASGKSLAMDRIKDMGFTVLRFDDLGRQVLRDDPEIAKELSATFGETLSDPSNPLTRKRLREILFSHPDQRKKMEALLHPKIHRLFESHLKEWKKKHIPVVFCESAIFVASGFNEKLDRLILIKASEETRLKRLVERDGISESLAKSMIQEQLPQEEIEKHADLVFENEADFEFFWTEFEKWLVGFTQKPSLLKALRLILYQVGRHKP